VKKLSKAKYNYKKRERKMMNQQVRREGKAEAVVPVTAPKRPTHFAPLKDFPEPLDIVYEENHGLVKYRVQEQYEPRGEYPECIMLEAVYDWGDGHFKPGHQSIRKLHELMKEMP